MRVIDTVSEIKFIWNDIFCQKKGAKDSWFTVNPCIALISANPLEQLTPQRETLICCQYSDCYRLTDLYTIFELFAQTYLTDHLMSRMPSFWHLATNYVIVLSGQSYLLYMNVELDSWRILSLKSEMILLKPHGQSRSRYTPIASVLLQKSIRNTAENDTLNTQRRNGNLRNR